MSLLLFLACTADVSLRFVSPDSGARVASGAPAAIVVGVTPADRIADVELRFHIEGSTLDGELTVDREAGQATFTTTALPLGSFQLGAEATDGEDRAEAERTFTGFTNGSPVVTFSNPVDGGVVLAGTPFEVRATILDADDIEGIGEIALAWTGIAASSQSAPRSVLGGGDVHFLADALAEGEWEIGLAVTDANGGVGAANAHFAATGGDEDGDGYTDDRLGGDDCDDEDAAVNPGGRELCNGLDDDCNGAVDDDAVGMNTWYDDDDADGYGDDSYPKEACELPEGHAAVAGDCDDDDPDVNPGALEQCETGIDEDCDGIIDTDAETSFRLWIDSDGDGYGRGAAVVSCAILDGYATASGDCDDSLATVNPGAAELCDASDRDEDCDGKTDDDDESATGQTRHYQDTDGDGYGDALTPGDRCDAGAGWSANDGDCDDGEALSWTGATETCEDGADNDCSGGDSLCALAGSLNLSGADVKLTGAGANGFCGAAVSGAGDRDADGLADVAAGCWGYGTGGTVYLLDGGLITSGSMSAGVAITAEAAGDELGVAVAACGDVDGDGRADVVFSAPGYGTLGGAVYLWSGARGAGVASAADDEVDGANNEVLGASLDCGHDVDDDGAIDVLVGASGTGAAYLYEAETLTKWAKLTGGTGSGGAVALLDDVDGDGVDDALVGDEQANKAWLVLGSTSLGNLTLASGADAAYTGEATGDTAGASVAGLGDIDGDGYGDLAIGAPENDNGGAAAGSAYLVLGQGTPVTTALGSADATLRGIDASDRAGDAVSGPGDTDDDGRNDVLVGAYYDETSGSGAGVAYLLYGAVSLPSGSLSGAGATLLGESARDSAGEAVGGAGDVDGDGTDDVLVGAPSEASAASGAGAVYLFWGGAG